MGSTRVIKASIGYTVGNILIKGITFFTLPIFTRLLTPNEFGIFSTYMAYEAIIAILIGLGIYAALKNAKYDYPGQLDVFFTTLIYISTITLLVLLFVFLIGHTLISNFTGFNLEILIILVFHSYGTVLLGLYNAKLSLDYLYKKYLVISLLNTFLNITSSLILILFVFNNSGYARIIGSALPLLVISVYIVIGEGRKSKFRYKIEMAKYALFIGLPLIWHLISQVVLAQTDRIMITRIIGSSFTGKYSFIYSIAIVFQVIFNSTDNVWSVWFYEKMDKKDYHSITKAYKKYIYILAFIASLMIVVSKELIQIMSSKDYWDSINIFIPIILGLFLMFLSSIPIYVEYYFKKTKFIAFGTAIAAIANLLMNLTFIKMFGYEAAAYSTMMSYLLIFTIHWFIASKLLKQQGINNFLNIKDFLMVFSLLLLIGILVTMSNPYPLVKYTSAIIFFAVSVYSNKDLIFHKLSQLKKRES